MSRWRDASPFMKASVGVHGAALAAIAAAPETSPVALTSIAANHLIIAGAGLFPRCSWLGPNMTRLPPQSRDDVLCLTFDDGPDPSVTPQVLAMLGRAGQRATFFCIGARAAAHPGIVADISAQGHGVENHTYSHPSGFALRGPRGMADEIERAQDAIERASGRRPRFFRAPAGMQNPFLPDVLATQGLGHVSWTRRGFDAVSRNATRVAERLIGPGLAAREILLLHDRVTTRSPEKHAIAIDVLPRLIDAVAHAGLRSEALHVALADPTPATGRSVPAARDALHVK